MSKTMWVLVSVAIALGIQFFVMSPLEAKREEVRERLFVQYKALQKYEKFVKDAKHSEAQFKQSRQELEKIEKGLLKETDLPLAFAELQGRVQGMAEDAGLSLTTYRPLTAHEQSGYQGIPIVMEGVGSINQISEFLKTLDDTDDLISLTQMSISVVPQGNLRIKVELMGLAAAGKP